MSGRFIIGEEITEDLEVTCDVCIVGSGAGGGMLAAELTARGLDVVMLEAGGYHTRKDFDLEEAHAYPMLYQDRGGRSTVDQGITILQGRNVGGGTTVNWTTCFRTPDPVLSHWADVYGVEGWSADELRPHFEAVEKRLNIGPWDRRMANANNRVLLDGCEKLGWQVDALRRNVKHCGNTGYCALGCPIDAKQGMMVTTLPEAVGRGMRLYADVKVERLVTDADRVVEVVGKVLDRRTGRPNGRGVVVRPKVAVSSAGAINSPALLLRSGINDHGRVGVRTFLHPVVAVVGLYDQVIDGWRGAPQSMASHHFIDRGEGRVGFFIETPPMQPMLAAGAGFLIGRDQQRLMSQLKHMSALLAVCHDGLLSEESGGTVTLKPDGRIAVDYPIEAPLQEAFRAAHKALAQIHLAAGVKEARSTHIDPISITGQSDLPRFEGASYGVLEVSIFSAHQMGGCTMGPDPKRSVVSSRLRHHRLANLFVVDGSVFPTGVGVNTSESIYGLAHRAAEFVAEGV